MPAITPAAFIGRSQEIDEIRALLDDPSCRLLTLVGPGGIGKTRLATELSARLQTAFPDGVYFVSLAPLTHAAQILTAIAEQTPFRFQQDGRDPHEQFFAYLREKHAKRSLFVLDNFEHLLDGAEIVSGILAVTTEAKVLVTSREALNLQEEWVRQVGGLSYPSLSDGRPLETYSAVLLFLDAARRVRGDFSLADHSASVVEICRLVDGMPLAIELAAGWLKTLQPEGIAQEIRRSMDILATRSRNLPERHRSIRSVFTQSWELLSGEERDVFQKLSVFRGGFTREAAGVVAGASLHTLAGLVDKSLVRLNPVGRYEIHELLRQYGAEQMDAAGQTPAVEDAYIRYFLGILRQLEPDIKAFRQINALDVIATDFENIRTAWLLAVERGHFAAMDGAVESLHFFADMRGRYHEVIALLRAAVEIDVADSATVYGTLLRIQARLARLILLSTMQIDVDLRRQIDECLAAARTRNDQREIGFCLLVSAIVAQWEANTEGSTNFDKANGLLEECYTIYEALGDRFYMAEALVWLGSHKFFTGNRDPGEEQMARGLAIRREIDDRNGIAWITLNLTDVMIDRLDYLESERYARQALTLMREIGSVKGVIETLSRLIENATLRGELDEARVLAEEMREMADAANILDSKRLSVGLLSFLICVGEEDYEQGAALARQHHAISMMPFYGHDNVSGYWGRGLADCGLGRFNALRAHYPSLVWERRDDPAAGTVCLSLEAAVLAHEGEHNRAAALLGLAFNQPPEVTGWLRRWPLIARLRQHLRDELGEDNFHAAWERGCHLDLESEILKLLGEAPAAPRAITVQPLIEPLSDRELEVLALIRDGLSNRDIAERLFLSVGTVKVHTRNIYGKLSVSSRTQAVAEAARYHLLP
jgi:predicted ATPase/DNA-binding CsgD family transcriptional regulator